MSKPRDGREPPGLNRGSSVALLALLGVTALLLSGCGTAATTGTATTHRSLAATTTAVGTTRPSISTSRSSPSALTGLGITGRWHQILNAEFRGDKLNTKLWRPDWFGTGVTGPINSTTEVACYDSKNATVPGDDTLHLMVSAVHSTCAGLTREFTGAIVSSDPRDGRNRGGFQFRYGVLQARIYLPRDYQGQIANWPGLLVLGQHFPEDGEDDVMQGIQGELCSYFRSPGLSGANAPGKCRRVTPGWHTFSVNWEPGRVTWYYDRRKLTSTFRGVTSAPMYIVLVNSVKLQLEEDAQPGVMKVAYVRVWQRTHRSSG